MSIAYVQTVTRIGWLLRQIEESLGQLDDGRVVDVRVIRGLSRDRLPSDEEASAVLSALEGIGVLRHNGHIHRLDLPQLMATSEYRRGVRDAFAYKSMEPTESVTLCMALPVGLEPTITECLQSKAVDLRAALLDIVVSARKRLVVASPFWDKETATDVAEVLCRRLAAGVAVDLLGRFDRRDAGTTTLLSQLSPYTNCRLLRWYVPHASDRFGSQTFHFKAAVADGGRKAYLGTANLTTSSLRSRMELGVILTGPSAERLSHIIDQIVHLANVV